MLNTLYINQYYFNSTVWYRLLLVKFYHFRSHDLQAEASWKTENGHLLQQTDFFGWCGSPGGLLCFQMTRWSNVPLHHLVSVQPSDQCAGGVHCARHHQTHLHATVSGASHPSPDYNGNEFCVQTPKGNKSHLFSSNKQRQSTCILPES